MPMTKRISENNQARHQRHWQAHVNAAEKSGLSRAEYCRRYNLSYHTMTYWKRKLSRSNNCQTTLVPVTLPAALVRKGREHNQAELQIILPGKMSVAVGNDFSPATLRRLLTVLETR
jgi:hypothetical protein